jgi:hypothetical protein
MNPEANLGSILLKLRFLASRLGSLPLADWVKHEAEGYPNDATIPDYRIVGVTYTGSWSGPWGSGIQDAPIPPHLIKEFAGEKWVHHEARDSVASIEALVSNDTGNIGINAANLILLLQGKVYKGYACNAVTGIISKAAMVGVLQNVRSRVLELTIQLESEVPASAGVEVASPVLGGVDKTHVSHIVHQTIFGNLTQISASGGSQVSLNIAKGDIASVRSGLIGAGLVEAEAKEIADIIASEEPKSTDQPLGTKAAAWIAKSAGKLAGGAGKLSLSALTKVLEEAALRYFGLK